MIRRPPRSTRTDTLPTRRSSDLQRRDVRHRDPSLRADRARGGRMKRTHLPLNGLRVLDAAARHLRSEEHTSELQSLMRISYAVFCLKKKTHIISISQTRNIHTYTNTAPALSHVTNHQPKH